MPLLTTRFLTGAVAAAILTIGLAVPAALAVPANTPKPASAAQGAADAAKTAELGGDPVRGKRVYTDVGRCTQCHGWGGNGVGSDPRSPGKAADLRATTLDTETLRNVVRCGLPGTDMPYHGSDAYKKPEACFGQVLADFKEGEAPHKGRTFREVDINNVVAFIEDHFKGKGPVTLAECEDFFKPGAKNCVGLK